MSLRSVPSSGGSRNSASSHITPRPTRSLLLKAALRYAQRGIPVFPLHSVDAAGRCSCGNAKCDSRGKHPRVGGGFKAATRDQSRITAWWNRWPNANIGIPTGKASGIVSVDLDVYKAGAWNQGDAEREKGPLPDTATVATGRGGLQFWYAHPEGQELPGSPENTIGPGFCVKSGGGYVVAPPSATAGTYRTVLRMDPSDLPAWLAKELETKDASRRRGDRRGPRPGTTAGETIPEGSRNGRLFFEALAIKDAGGTPEEVLDRLLGINAARCSPPLDAGEVEGIAKSACRYPVRSGSPSPEVLETVERLEEFWWAHHWAGMGGKTDRDIYRVLIELARRYGHLLPDGSLAVSASVRSVALAAATRYETVSGRATKRLASAGLIRKRDGGRGAAEAATWVLLPQASLPVNTQASAAIREAMPCVYDQLRPRLWDLSTPSFRWTGHVKKGRAGVLYVLEAHGPMGLRELADRMGWGNYRELKRRYLEDREREDGSVLQGLISMGLVEDCGGVYALHGDHAERVEGVRCAPYTTVSRRRRETHDGDRVVRWVEETENTASEVEREEKDLQDHEKQRERFRLYLVRKSPEADEECRKLLNVWDDEREFFAGEVEPDGEISELERLDPPDPDGTIKSESEVFDLARAFFAREAAA